MYRSRIIHLRQQASIHREVEQRPVTYSKKEMFQPHLPVRLPCYDLAPVIGFTLDNSLRSSS